jgi:Rrf2 family nitric oxide-sensitive transcriptional repressor
MRLTTFSDYSLRVLMYLAVDPPRRATIAEIATSFQISESHLNKVVHFLGRNGWLANARGKGGGLSLAKAPELIHVGTIVRQAEGADLLAECFDPQTNRCVITRCCKLQGVLGEAARAFYGALDRHTLADLVQNRATLGKLLFIE